MRLQWYTVSFLVIMMQSASALANDVIWKEEPQNTTSVKGCNITLRCSFDGIIEGGPLPRWFQGISGVSYGVTVATAKQGLCHVVGNHTIGEYNLLITNVSAESAGEWKCSHVLASPQTKSAYLDVIDSVEWNEVPHNTTVHEGENVILKCRLDGIGKDSELPQWSLSDLKVSEGANVFRAMRGRYRIVGNRSKGEYNLLIPNVTKESQGIWKCSHILAKPQTQDAYLEVIESRPLISSGDDGLVAAIVVPVVVGGAVCAVIAICVIVARRKRNNVNFPCRRYKEVQKDIVI
ncbi:uncharacterized protein LOC144440246 isoform X2 [Glandiceps talaboti]